MIYNVKRTSNRSFQVFCSLSAEIVKRLKNHDPLVHPDAKQEDRVDISYCMFYTQTFFLWATWLRILKCMLAENVVLFFTVVVLDNNSVYQVCVHLFQVPILDYKQCVKYLHKCWANAHFPVDSLYLCLYCVPAWSWPHFPLSLPIFFLPSFLLIEMKWYACRAAYGIRIFLANTKMKIDQPAIVSVL